MSAAEKDVKKILPQNISEFSLDEKQSKGEICDGLEIPIWDKVEKDDVLRFGPHIFFSDINNDLVTERDNNSNCSYQTRTTFKKNVLDKNINQVCKNKKMSAATTVRAEILNDKIIITYQQKTGKKEKNSTCIYKKDLKAKDE